jgi:hypothetical protein
MQLLRAAAALLGDEDQLYRPRDERNRPGGLIRLADRITIVVPDLHARLGFLPHVLSHEVRGKPFLQLMREGTGQIVCVGDGLHSESRGYGRWQKALKEFIGGFSRHKAMDEEMMEGLGLMEMVMRLKLAFPDRFHFLKGNHENILNEEGRGNHPFRKFAFEGEMVRSWIQKFYGDELLYAYADFERELPLVAADGNFIISHGEPERFYSREEVIRYRSLDDVVYGLTWTPNGGAEEGSVSKMIDEFCTAPAEAFYFGGHRVISERYALRAEGRYVQLHNPSAYIVAVLEPGERIDPEYNVVELPDRLDEILENDIMIGPGGEI